MKEILKFQNVKLNYYSRTAELCAVDNLSFSVKEGEFISLIGPSGCGKTSILSMISGLLPATEGQILLNDKVITKPDSQIGYMFQKDHLFSFRNILENITIGLEIQHKKTAKNMQFAKELLKKYGLWEFATKYPHELSGGMKQRVALIRTLVQSPDLLLLDEPFSALDFQTRLKVSDDVHKIIKSENKTAILITHDISESISMSDRILVLTKRPAQMLAIHNVNLQGLSPIERRDSPQFSAIFDVIWREITNEEN